MAIADPTAPVAQSHSLELPAVIAADVPVLKFSEALVRAGLVGRRDAARGVLVIEPIPALCVGCGGAGLDEDAVCDFCDGVGAVQRDLPIMADAPSVIIRRRPAIAPAAE